MRREYSPPRLVCTAHMPRRIGKPLTIEECIVLAHVAMRNGLSIIDGRYLIEYLEEHVVMHDLADIEPVGMVS